MIDKTKISLLVIGDVHGKINEYWKLINKYNIDSIQLGDFGFKRHHNWHLENVDSSKHKINFGNHVDLMIYKSSPASVLFKANSSILKGLPLS